MSGILFIHPDDKIIGLYGKYLTPQFSVDSAQDGLMGLRKIKANRPRVIISEYNLPYLSGLSLLKFVRQHKEMFATPFIFLTNDDMPDQALGMGASAWLNQREHGPEALLRQLINHV